MPQLQSAPKVDFSNLEQAQKDMKLTNEEVNLYQHHLKNLHGSGKVTNPDGSISTIYQMNIEQNGKHYNIPTVWDGKILEPDAAVQKANDVGINVFPSYGSESEAEARYQKMHTYMEKDTKAYLGVR